jgi:hypothetical protein
MHDKHEPDCFFCEKFVLPFDEDSPLADWGYCAEGGREAVITREKLKEIEEQVKKGDYSFLTKGEIPLYQAVGEGCEKFVIKEHH